MRKRARMKEHVYEWKTREKCCDIPKETEREKSKQERASLHHSLENERKKNTIKILLKAALLLILYKQ